MKSKLLAILLLSALFLTIVHTMAKWNDSPGVFDNICYLRQAHLFQRFGLVGGLDTDLRRDDDGFFSGKLIANGIDPARLPCHHLFASTGKTVVQYPPGAGMLLALFPAGVQTAGLYISCTAIVFLLISLGVGTARSTSAVWALCLLGLLTIYYMVNPTRSSYSLPGTVALCCLSAVLTPMMFAVKNRAAAIVVAGSLGFCLGVSVDMRIGNLFLVAGYFVYFVLELVVPRLRRPDGLLRAFVFGFCALVGVIPTLAANAINVGSPFSTTYTGTDVYLPEFGIGLATELFLGYLQGNQGLMLGLAIALTILFRRICGTSDVAVRTFIVVVANLLINMGYYLTHNSVAPYYCYAIATLTVWTVAFCYRRVSVPAKEVLEPASA